MLLHAFFCNECGCQHRATPGLDHNCVRASAGRRTAWRQHVDKHGLQGARLPHSLQKTMFKEIGKIPEAAREGIVPLCEDDSWNPQDAPGSPHSGLIRQPTKEGIPEGESPSQGFHKLYIKVDKTEPLQSRKAENWSGTSVRASWRPCRMNSQTQCS